MSQIQSGSRASSKVGLCSSFVVLGDEQRETAALNQIGGFLQFPVLQEFQESIGGVTLNEVGFDGFGGVVLIRCLSINEGPEWVWRQVAPVSSC